MGCSDGFIETAEDVADAQAARSDAAQLAIASAIVAATRLCSGARQRWPGGVDQHRGRGISAADVSAIFAVAVASAKLAGREYHTEINWNIGPNAGQEVAYWDLTGGMAWAETGIFLFGVAMILEALALAIVSSRVGGKRPVVVASLGVVVIATIINLVAAFKVFNVGAIPTISGLAVAFGGYMAMYQWKLLRLLNTGRSAPMT